MTEFDLIKRYFARPSPSALVGNGDDCAVVAPRPGNAFAITTDTLIEGRHFLPTIDPLKLGARAVAVNMSDLAAMGAAPRFVTLSLTLPRIHELWLERFSCGLWGALDDLGVELIGGNTTRGPLAISLTALGEVPVLGGAAQTLLRSGARAGDELWVSGLMGDAGWALYCLLGDPRVGLGAAATAAQIARYESPRARVELGLALRNIATSCIDVSDGLLSEANHLAEASNVSIQIDFAAIPTGLSEWMTRPAHAEFARQCVLATGDSYELLFTAPQDRHSEIALIFAGLGLPGACIGRVSSSDSSGNESGQDKVSVLDAQLRPMNIETRGWDHFKEASS